MNKQLLFAMSFAGMLYAVVSHAESEYYVQSASAKIWLDASFKSKVIGEAGRGKLLMSTGQEGSWIKVKFDNQNGYVPSLLLSMHPPLEKTAIIKAEDSEIKEGVRRRASSYSSAAAARGLSKEDRQRADVEEGTDYGALQNMESPKFTDKEIKQFTEEGKL